MCVRVSLTEVACAPACGESVKSVGMGGNFQASVKCVRLGLLDATQAAPAFHLHKPADNHIATSHTLELAQHLPPICRLINPRPPPDALNPLII